MHSDPLGVTVTVGDFVLSFWWKQKEVTDNLKYTSGTLLKS